MTSNFRNLTLASLGVFAVACLLSGAAPAAADFRTERELDLEPGGRLVLDLDAGSVDIRGTSSSGARIIVTSEDDDIEEKYEFSFDASPGVVTVKADRIGPRAKRWFNWGSTKLRFEIEVPESTEIDVDTAGGSIEARSLVGDAKVDTSGGSIEVRKLHGRLIADTSGGAIVAEEIDGDANLDTSGGSIRAEAVSGDLVASTSGGSIRIQGVGGSVDASTSGGSVAIEGVGGRIDAESSGGPISASFGAGNGAGGSLRTSGGSVTAYVDPAVALDIDASSSGGGVTVDVPITVQGKISRGSVSGTLNGGGPRLVLRSSGGGVRVKSL